MVNFINLSYENYLKKYRDYKIVCVGAGGTCLAFIKQHMDKPEMLGNIICIADNDVNKAGVSIQAGTRFLTVENLSAYSFESKKLLNEKTVIFLLVNEVYAIPVLRQLDGMQCFDGMDCIYGLGTFQWGYSFYPLPKQTEEVLSETTQEHRIPDRIHYCWFGGGKIPDRNKRCIDSWSRLYPDYEIRFWNEETYDMSNVPAYVTEAYEAEKYAFVSDYVRLDVIHKFGGIYLDTDVELIRKIDDFQKYRAFFAFMEYGEIATGLGFGGEAGCAEIKEMMDLYQEIPFKMQDGSYNLTPCPRYTNDYFRRRGISMDNILQIDKDILFLPSDYLCPMTPVPCKDGSYQLAQLVLTHHTRAVHWCDNSWKDQEDREIFEQEKELRRELNQRLLRDWKRTEGID